MQREQDQSLTRRETAIPGLRYLLAPSGLRELLLANTDIDDPGELTPAYLRYKPGMNCIARFDFEVDGQPQFAYAKAFGADAQGKLDKAMERPDPGSILGPGKAALAKEQILFSVFPADAKLRSLEKLNDSKSRSGFLARLFKAKPGWESASFTPLNYKPERRFVAKFTNPGGDSATVKFYSRTEFARVREFRKHLEDTPGVRVPDWIGGSKAHHALAFDWIPGITLREYQPENGLDAVFAAGSTIARFHQGRQHRFRTIDASAAANRPLALSRDLAMILPEVEAQAAELAGQLKQWKLEQSADVVPVHGDFYDKQVLVNENGLALIDSDNAHLGDPLGDIACYIAHLERNVVNRTMGKDEITPVTDALLLGYRAVVPGINTRTLNQQVAFYLFQLIHNPFRDRANDWPEQTQLLINRCGDLFRSP